MEHRHHGGGIPPGLHHTMALVFSGSTVLSRIDKLLQYPSRSLAVAFCVWQMLGAAFNQCGTRSQSQERRSATRPTRSRFCLRLHLLRHATCSQTRSFYSAPASFTEVSSLCPGVSVGSRRSSGRRLFYFLFEKIC